MIAFKISDKKQKQNWYSAYVWIILHLLVKRLLRCKQMWTIQTDEYKRHNTTSQTVSQFYYTVCTSL